MIRGKTGFWLLVLIFSLMTMLVVFNNENFGSEIVKDMDGTMGQMMTKEHAAGSSLSEVFSNAWSQESQASQGNHSISPTLKSMDLVGSLAMLVMLPLILGTSVLMIILWS